jgi:hypothetical protein
MSDQTGDRGWTSSLGRVGGALVASLILCVGAGAATVHEASLPGGDFNDFQQNPTILPDGTDETRGVVSSDELSFDLDAFAFTDLQPGATFTASLFDPTGSSAGCCSGVLARIYDESMIELPGSRLGAVDISETPEVEYDFFVGTVPMSGELRVRVHADDTATTFRFTLDAPRVVVPEPSTGLLVAAGVCAVALWRRNRAGP